MGCMAYTVDCVRGKEGKNSCCFINHADQVEKMSKEFHFFGCCFTVVSQMERTICGELPFDFLALSRNRAVKCFDCSDGGGCGMDRDPPITGGLLARLTSAWAGTKSKTSSGATHGVFVQYV